jgi:lipid-A-disaccharide synthase
MKDPGQQVEGTAATLKIFLVAVEESGDQLGAALMRALRQRLGDGVQFSGVGGRRMAGEGLDSLHSIDDFSIMGVTAVPGRLPLVVRHLRETLRAVRTQKPHALVVIDSPGYSLWVAHFVRRANRAIKIIDYVSPSVWAWRPSRARSMRRYIDHVLALLPFEPEVHRRLGGPACSYVGHPIIEQVTRFRPNAEEARRRLDVPPVLVVLPGSRSGEIQRHAPIFGQALARLRDQIGPVDIVLPTVPHLLDLVKAATASWPIQPRIVTEQADKQAAFRVARAALAKSGTVTLELALAGVPMIAAYKVSSLDAFLIRRVINVPSVILANLVLGRNVVPELLQEECTAERLAAALVPIVRDTPERQRQVDAFARLDDIMQIGTEAPALRAADIVLAELQARKRAP